MLNNYLAPDLLLQIAREREIVLAVLQAEHAAASDEGPRIKLEAEILRRTGMPLATIRRIPPEELVDIVKSNAGGNSTYGALMLAELLLVDVRLSEANGQAREAIGSRLQAFCLMAGAFSALMPELQQEYGPRLKCLLAELSSISNQPYLKTTLEEFRARAFPGDAPPT